MSGSIRSRGDLRSLLEKQMTAATTLRAPAPDEELEGRTALKAYLFETHGKLRSEPYATVAEIAARAGLDVNPTHEPQLIELSQGDQSYWLDVSGERFARLYTVVSAKEADRVHELLSNASPLLEPMWLLPEHLEGLSSRIGGRMVLFSLRHDRRALRREDVDRNDAVELVTLRFWAPSAEETLKLLRNSRVLPGATSVASVRVRLGSPEAYVLVEAYHTGKCTAVGNSFAELELVLNALETQATEAHHALENTARSWHLPLKIPAAELPLMLTRIFNGSEPFEWWGLPEQVSLEQWCIRAADLGVASVAKFEWNPEGITVHVPAQTPLSVAVRFVATIQYHLLADARVEGLTNDPLFRPPAESPVLEHAYDERSPMDHIARSVLTEAIAQWLRGGAILTPASVSLALHGPQHTTPALQDLARRVLTEVAANEWREWLRPMRDPERGGTFWRWVNDVPLDLGIRSRELLRMHKAALALVQRFMGGVTAPWSQLSLFNAENLVPPAIESLPE